LNNNGKTRKKFSLNFIDIVLILIILCAGILLAYMFSSRNTSTSESSGEIDLTYKVIVKEMRSEFKNLVSIGDKVVDSVQLFTIGTVVDVTYSPSTYTGKDVNNGKLVYSEYPDKLDMVITVKTKANVGADAYLIGGFNLGVGTKIHLRVPKFTAIGYCSAVAVDD